MAKVRIKFFSTLLGAVLYSCVFGRELIQAPPELRPNAEVTLESGVNTFLQVESSDLNQKAIAENPTQPTNKEHQFWPSSVVYHFSFGEKLPDMLKDFCSMQDINVVLSQEIQKSEQKVNRAFRDYFPVEVWDQLTKTYGLMWFYDGNILYVYQATESETKVLQVHPEQVDSLVGLVGQLGFYSSRISLKALKEAGIVVASGPPKFMSLLEDMAKNMRFSKQLTPEDICVRVFHLKHAWALDKKVGDVVVPGVATLLSNILGIQSAVAPSNVPIDPTLSHQIKAQKGVLDEYAAERKARQDSKSHDTKKDAEEKEASQSDKNEVPKGGIVTTDSRQNALIVKDSKKNMSLYEELIVKLDVPLELIEIKAAIVSVDNKIGFDAGNNMLHLGGETDKHRIFMQPLGSKIKDTDKWSFDIRGIVNGKDFLTQIRYLESANSAKLLARPSVITMDNLEAIMDRRETTYREISGEKVTEMYPITTSTTLKVTPHIVRCEHQRPQIQLILDIKDGKSIASDDGKTPPSVSDSSILTQAIVYEGQSVLVGGYFHESHSHDESGIPLLKDIPVLGYAFKSKTKNKSVTERLFLITPTIVKLSASDSDPYGDYFKKVESGNSLLDTVQVSHAQTRGP